MATPTFHELDLTKAVCVVRRSRFITFAFRTGNMKHGTTNPTVIQRFGVETIIWTKYNLRWLI